MVRALLLSLMATYSPAQEQMFRVESGSEAGTVLVIGAEDATVGTSAEDINHELAAWTWLSSGTQMTVSSTDADDTSAGTGARSVIINYLDESYDAQTEIVTMNGQTAVSTTATDIFRVNQIFVISAGDSEYNEGTIYVGTGTVTNGVPAVIHGTVQPTESQSFDGKYTVPNGKSCYLVEVQLQSPGAKNATFELDLRINNTTGVRTVGFRWGLFQNSYFLNTFFGKLQQKTDVWWRGSVNSSTGDLKASFKCLLKDN